MPLNSGMKWLILAPLLVCSTIFLSYRFPELRFLSAWHTLKRWNFLNWTRTDTYSLLYSSPAWFSLWKWMWSHSVVSDFFDPTDCSLPGSSVHGILQARVLEWVAISFSRGSSQPMDWTQVSHIGGRQFNLWATPLLDSKHFIWIWIEFVFVHSFIDSFIHLSYILLICVCPAIT